MHRFIFCLFISFCAGCASQIGDECSSDLECGRARTCDLASRNGYCTVSPCVRGGCPVNSVCVEFEDESTFCMASCSGDGDCRQSEGYACDAEYGPIPFCRQTE